MKGKPPKSTMISILLLLLLGGKIENLNKIQTT
jgi:hypothetical protein